MEELHLEWKEPSGVRCEMRLELGEGQIMQEVAGYGTDKIMEPLSKWR